MWSAKKTYSGWIATVLLLSFAACGDDAKDDDAVRASDAGPDARVDEGRTETGSAGRGGAGAGGRRGGSSGTQAPPPPAAADCGICNGLCLFGVCLGGGDAGTRIPTDEDSGMPTGSSTRTPGSAADGEGCFAAMDCKSRVCRNFSCQAPTCGDRQCNGNEGTATCVEDCGTHCGDGVVNGSEACDDGNTKADDGCSDKCVVEDGFACTGKAPSICGDIDACLTAGCSAGELCKDSAAPAPDGEAGRTCSSDRACGDGRCVSPETVSSCPSDCATCGDGVCSLTETAAKCAAECTRCGDNLCTGDETAAMCASDCSRCGDGTCTGNENASMCPGDCTRCGDNLCTGNETAATCPRDCTQCGDRLCTGNETAMNCPGDCTRCGDKLCSGTESPTTCPDDCTRCGDGVCSGGEAVATCPGDCSMCGDGSCTGAETLASCPVDCSVCGDGTCSGNEAVQGCPNDCMSEAMSGGDAGAP